MAALLVPVASRGSTIPTGYSERTHSRRCCPVCPCRDVQIAGHVLEVVSRHLAGACAPYSGKSSKLSIEPILDAPLLGVHCSSGSKLFDCPRPANFAPLRMQAIARPGSRPANQRPRRGRTKPSCGSPPHSDDGPRPDCRATRASRHPVSSGNVHAGLQEDVHCPVGAFSGRPTKALNGRCSIVRDQWAHFTVPPRGSARNQ